MAINPLSNVRPPMQPAVTQNPSARGSKGPGGFGDMLKNCVEKVESDQQLSANAMKDLVAGKSDDILPVVAEIAKADMSFKLLVGVRNKMIDAYKQTMNMQV